MVYSQDMTIALICLVCLLVLVVIRREYLDWRDGRYEEESENETWECGSCGMWVESTTIEGIVEGMRIHQLIDRCDGEDIDGSYYEN